MALAIACGESMPCSSSHVVLIRLLNQTLDSIKYKVAPTVATMLSISPDSRTKDILESDPRHRILILLTVPNIAKTRMDESPLSAVGDLMPATRDHYQLKTQDWFLRKKNYNDNQEPPAVFNMLNATLKESLERLKMMRETISLAKIGFKGHTLKACNARQIAMIKDLCLEQKFGTALCLRREMIKKGVVLDVLTHNYILNGLCKIGEMEKADCLFREMLEIGPPPNLVTYNTFIKGCCLSNDVDKALHIFFTMTGRNITPNRDTCSILVHRLCKRHLLGDARKLLGKNFTADDNGVDIIRGFCLDRKFGSALLLRRKMIQRGILPDLLAHNYLLNGLCRIGDMNKADWLFREMIEKGPPPNHVTYNTFIKGYCLIDDMDKALYLFSTMANCSIRPNRVTCNILLHALCKKGLLQNAMKVLGEILSDDKGKATSNLITSTILMDGSFKNGDTVQALGYWDEMLQKNIQIDVVAYNVLIRGLCSSKNRDVAYGYLAEMLKTGLLPDVFTYNTLTSALFKEGKFDEACYIHGVMSRMGVAPDQVSYKVIIQGLCAYGDNVKANKFLLSMLKKSIVPAPIIWNLIVDLYGRFGDFKNAFCITDQMLAFGVVPNVYF
ncbi:hypothetical protein DITRI_Ditri16bG0141100 [Diplodiscus trichospermus]